MEKWQAARKWCEKHVGCPYVMGATGKTCTPAYRRARMAQYPTYADKIKENCPRLTGRAEDCGRCRWADASGRGKPAYDCAQLSRWCMDYVGVRLVSGASAQWQKTAWAEKGEIASLPRDRVCLVFRRDGGKIRHVGVYQGDGTVIHAKGHDAGVVRSNVTDDPWTHWGVPEGLYGAPYVRPALCRGDRGDYVALLQKRLTAAGFVLRPTQSAPDGCDGIFGPDTEEALTAFQKDRGLSVSGVCDASVWDALMEEAPAPAPQAAAESVPDVPSCALSQAEWQRLTALLSSLQAAVNILNGLLEEKQHEAGDK